MPSNHETEEWPWPDELDALIASPEHHKLLLENAVVRVLDTHIKPGETTALHTHRFPATFYIISFSDFIRCDEKGNIMLDSRDLTSPPAPFTATWSEPLPPHTLKNTGDQDLHVINVEIKK